MSGPRGLGACARSGRAELELATARAVAPFRNERRVRVSGLTVSAGVFRMSRPHMGTPPIDFNRQPEAPSAASADAVRGPARVDNTGGNHHPGLGHWLRRGHE